MKKIIIIIILLLNSILYSSCKESSKEKQLGETEHQDELENVNSTSLSEEQLKSIKVEFGSIEKKQLTSSLKANGILKVPNQNKANATASMGGVVKSILIQTGNTVSKGQIIATITNNNIIILQEEYLSVSAKLELAQIEYNRQKELQEGNAGALKTLQSANSELKILNARKSSLQKQLELIGINSKSLSSENIQSVTNIISPINGTVSNVLVNIGSYVDANNPIAEIVDNSQLHLDLYVYEKDLQKLKVGQSIHFTLTNNQGKEYDADVYAISNTFEQNTKAVSVHALVKGNKQGLIDGMSITALISLENATVDAVPSNAIINHEGKDYIFIVKDNHEPNDHDDKENVEEDKHDQNEIHTKEIYFEKIPIRKGTTDVGYSEITLLKSIPKNSKIVINGGFFILAKLTNKGEHAH